MLSLLHETSIPLCRFSAVSPFIGSIVIAVQSKNLYAWSDFGVESSYMQAVTEYLHSQYPEWRLLLFWESFRSGKKSSWSTHYGDQSRWPLLANRGLTIQ